MRGVNSDRRMKAQVAKSCLGAWMILTVPQIHQEGEKTPGTCHYCIIPGTLCWTSLVCFAEHYLWQVTFVYPHNLFFFRPSMPAVQVSGRINKMVQAGFFSRKLHCKRWNWTHQPKPDRMDAIVLDWLWYAMNSRSEEAMFDSLGSVWQTIVRVHKKQSGSFGWHFLSVVVVMY